MSNNHSDALVFFGATGDLAYKKIFPALQAMVKRGNLDVPVVGVAKAGWNLDQLRARAKDSLEKHGGVDPAAFEKLSGLLRYVDGDYQDPAAFEAAVADGADVIECDVQSTRDGVLVIRHDLAIGDQRVAERAFADIEERSRQLRCGRVRPAPKRPRATRGRLCKLKSKGATQPPSSSES